MIRGLPAALLLAVCWQCVLHAELSPAGVLAVSGVVLAGLALSFLAHAARIATAVTARPLSGRAAALREKSRGAVGQRLLDPDTAGRPRPRAPSAAPAAA
jgi:hypothetical protein